MTLTHISQVTPKMIGKGNLDSKAVQLIADALEIEAFISDEDNQWYGFNNDNESEDNNDDHTIDWLPLTPELAQRLMKLGHKILWNSQLLPLIKN